MMPQNRHILYRVDMKYSCSLLKRSLLLSLAIPVMSLANGPSGEPTPVLQWGFWNSQNYQSWGHGEFANHWSPNDAVAFLLDFGTDQFRGDINWAHQLTDNQRFKLGVEHFAQDNTYLFASAPDHDFIGQNSVGATYQYLFSDRRIAALSLTGYYGAANDGDFKVRPFDNGYGSTLINNRTVIGATIAGIGFGPTTHLWRGALLTTNVNYDSVSYNPTTAASIGSHGFGPMIMLTQQFSPRFSINLTANQRQPYQSYQASANCLVYNKPGYSLELGLNGGYFHSNDTWQSHDTYGGLNATFKWGGAPRTLTSDVIELLNWSMTSPASLPAVFVMKDENVVP